MIVFSRYLILIWSFCTIICSCQSTPSTEHAVITGMTMGTSYRITHEMDCSISQQNIEHLLKLINQAVSTYIDSSIISRFNQSDSGIVLSLDQKDSVEARYFLDNLNRALEVCRDTDGWFDPTVMSLVNYWGFGYSAREKRFAAMSDTVASLLQNVGCEKISIQRSNQISISKSNEKTALDFSAIAKGYAVDQIAMQLINADCNDFLVDIGGEVRSKGHNRDGELWKIGINKPKEDADRNEIIAVIHLKDQAAATSGNYRNFYQTEDGQIISHTVNPKTGMPERNELVSVSIIAKDCTTADAYATACMSMGLQRAKKLIELNDDLEGVLIYSASNGSFLSYISAGIQDIVDFIEK